MHLQNASWIDVLNILIGIQLAFDGDIEIHIQIINDTPENGKIADPHHHENFLRAMLSPNPSSVDLDVLSISKTVGSYKQGV